MSAEVGMRPATARTPAQTDVEATVRELARTASVEVPARQLAAIDVSDYLASGTEVYVPYPPGAEWRDTVAACVRLRRAGMQPVPHLVARTVVDANELRRRLVQLAEAGVERLFLVAGDSPRPVGRYRDTLDVLESGLLVDYGFRRLGVAAHPEGHPQAKPADLERALARKAEYAATQGISMWIVTQFAFASAATVAWLDQCRARRFPLPIRVGVAGPARLSTLLAFAARCGVRASARMAVRRRGALRLLGHYAPDAILGGLAHHRTDVPDTPLCGIHVFTFGGIARTSAWLRAGAAATCKRPGDDAVAYGEPHDR